MNHIRSQIGHWSSTQVHTIMIFLRRQNFLIAFSAALTALPMTSASAQTWPAASPIRIVVPFAAGGPADSLARFLGAQMSADLGQRIVIDNKAGAGGTIGAADVAKSPPNGYTFLFSSTGALVIFPALSANLPYSPERDLIAVGHAVTTPQVVVVSNKSTFKSLDELVKAARASPGKLNFASAGNATTPQLGAELLKRDAKISMTHIAYRGAAPAITDLIAGNVDVMFADIPAAIAFIKSGQLKALALADSKSSDLLPGVKTTGELGFKGVVSGTWYGLMTAAKTPDEIVVRVNASLNKALQQAETQAFLQGQGALAIGGSAADFDKFIKAESIKWSAIAKTAGVKLD
jgi:tripartite-type tricarboxylate transporter receptor subunit TctC